MTYVVCGIIYMCVWYVVLQSVKFRCGSAEAKNLLRCITKPYYRSTDFITENCSHHQNIIKTQRIVGPVYMQSTHRTLLILLQIVHTHIHTIYIYIYIVSATDIYTIQYNTIYIYCIRHSDNLIIFSKSTIYSYIYIYIYIYLYLFNGLRWRRGYGSVRHVH